MSKLNLEKAVEMGARHLKNNDRIIIEIENGFAGVYLEKGDNKIEIFSENGEGLSWMINEAINISNGFI